MPGNLPQHYEHSPIALTREALERHQSENHRVGANAIEQNAKNASDAPPRDDDSAIDVASQPDTAVDGPLSDVGTEAAFIRRR